MMSNYAERHDEVVVLGEARLLVILLQVLGYREALAMAIESE